LINVSANLSETLRSEFDSHNFTVLADSENRAQISEVGTIRYELMKTNEKKISRRVPPRQVGRMVERVVGCKWSLTVVDLVQRGIRRPGAMERTVEGLTAKVLNDCLRLLVSYGVLEKRSFPEVPPRVEYHFTSFGRKFVETFKILDALEEKLARARRTKDGKAADRAACRD
jgi:DNA-binding HxlR family transcriptional regulator